MKKDVKDRQEMLSRKVRGANNKMLRTRITIYKCYTNCGERPQLSIIHPRRNKQFKFINILFFYRTPISIVSIKGTNIDFFWWFKLVKPYKG